ncbi:MAG: 4-alpha-glucanotransferase [Acidobacteriota bacterium]|nr:4-alpha-glucanotransferase [Acidobacteriota bacterium]MDE3189433.1 4-alpha-glucanotransferase [Acidobacteriota bacterium]
MSREVSRIGEDRNVERVRSSGILLHPTSLPGGRLDGEAYRFVDWLAAAGQSWWQMLPLGPPDEFGSPYRTSSAFAASAALLADPTSQVGVDEVEDFAARHRFWIGSWPRIADQVRFEREWSALRAYARERGVRLIGDVPIYVSDDGMDVASWPELFEHGEVAGAPPDPLNANGQHWGNPLYDWPAHRLTGFRWWIERFRRTLELVDVARVDHFRGFVSYWAIPPGRKTARNGRWRPAPGYELFAAVEAALGDVPLIAEDLGVITPAVYRLRDAFGLPGMVVLQWAWGGPPANLHAPRNHPADAVVYTSTHDTDTATGWFAGLTRAQRAATGLDPAEPNWGLIGLAMRSRAYLAVVPAQDVLGLGSDARMNHPGVVHGNWRWRLERGALTAELAARLRETTIAGGRLAGPARVG